MRARFLSLLLITLVAACTLPGAQSPTPFTFPTPNLTLTYVFAPTATATAPPPTLPPVEASATPIETEGSGAPAPGATATSSGTTGTRPNGSPITAALATVAPTIDGDLTEWTTEAYRADRNVFGASAWSGTSDLLGTFYVAWDTANLYLAVRVNDDTFVQTSTGSLMYKGDEVEIQFDSDLPGDFSSRTLSADDYQIGLSPGDFASHKEETYRWYPLSKVGAVSSVVVAATRTGSGYDLEARIPWAVLGVTPSVGSRYGFALSLSDNDLAGVAAQQSMVSSVSTRRLADPTTWGTLILGDSAGK